MLQPTGGAWEQVAGQLAGLGLAFVLSSLIGLERELRQRSAGLRTYTLVGLGSALTMVVSKYGFDDVLGPHSNVDPSRVAAGVVTGIGFIGGGLIFVHRGTVIGLTTAAGIWLTAAIGMAAGAGLPVLAVVTTAAYFLVVYGYTPLVNQLPGSKYAPSTLVMTYRDGQGVLRVALATCTGLGFAVERLSTGRDGDRDAGQPGMVSVVLEVRGRRPVTELAAALSELDGVATVGTEDAGSGGD